MLNIKKTVTYLKEICERFFTSAFGNFGAYALHRRTLYVNGDTCLFINLFDLQTVYQNITLRDRLCRLHTHGRKRYMDETYPFRNVSVKQYIRLEMQTDTRERNFCLTRSKSVPNSFYMGGRHLPPATALASASRSLRNNYGLGRHFNQSQRLIDVSMFKCFNRRRISRFFTVQSCHLSHGNMTYSRVDFRNPFKI